MREEVDLQEQELYNALEGLSDHQREAVLLAVFHLLKAFVLPEDRVPQRMGNPEAVPVERQLVSVANRIRTTGRDR